MDGHKTTCTPTDVASTLRSAIIKKG